MTVHVSRWDVIESATGRILATALTRRKALEIADSAGPGAAHVREVPCDPPRLAGAA